MITVRIQPLGLVHAAALLEVRSRNRAHLEPWEPQRDVRFYTFPGQREVVETALAAREAGRGFSFVIEVDGRLAGAVNLNNVTRGVFQNADLGYWVDGALIGRGVATEAVRQAIRFAFGEAGLHRVQAAALPRNVRSLRVLEKVGFREEGTALRYLQIAGAWEDHRIFALTAEEWPG